MKREKELLIAIPAYNEEGNIGKLFDKMKEAGITEYADVVVMNDSSTDKTREIVLSYGHSCITHVYHLGYCGALQLAYKYALRNGYQYLVQMDGDGQHDVCNVPSIYAKLKEKDEKGQTPDLVLGERFRDDLSAYKVSVFKRLAIAYFRWWIKVGAKITVMDPTTGLQGLNRRAIQYCSRFKQYDSQDPDANMLIQMSLQGLRIAGVPGVMHIREAGRSMHAGLEPIFYMIRMTLCILAVLFRVRVLKWKGVGLEE